MRIVQRQNTSFKQIDWRKPNQVSSEIFRSNMFTCCDDLKCKIGVVAILLL